MTFRRTVIELVVACVLLACRGPGGDAKPRALSPRQNTQVVVAEPAQEATGEAVVPHHDEKRVMIPGTGVSLVASDDLTLSPIGALMTDASRKTVLSIVIGSSGADLTRDSLYMRGYPEPPATILVGSTNALLFRRTRAEHGGGFDAWWLHVVEGSATLEVQLMYTGDDGSYFAEQERVMSTVLWDPTRVDALESLGATVEVEGLQLNNGVVGLLGFSDSPEVSNASVTFTIQPIAIDPTPFVTSPAACSQVLRDGFGKERHSTPKRIRTETIVGCEAHSIGEGETAPYRALLVLEHRAVAFVMADAEASKLQRWLPIFKRATRELRITR